MAKNDVTYERLEVVKAKKKYQIIEDAISGQKAIKDKSTNYLPLPSECSNSSDPRYQAYITRALYYNLIRPTRDALVGQLFLRPPKIELPDQLKVLEEDATGENLSLINLIKQIANNVLPYGRSGLLADFPTTSGETTVAQLRNNEVRPIIRYSDHNQIRNWDYRKIGSVWKLSLIVLDEITEERKDESYKVEKVEKQRVYELKNNNCVECRIYRDNKEEKRYDICGIDGKPLDEIPFEFIGSENNDASIDEPPFENFADINIAHYRNSADYEESVFIVGQPTLGISGMTQEWLDKNYPDGITFGSRTAITTGPDGEMVILQADPNTLAFEAMKHKEKQMFDIGAKIISPREGGVERKEIEVKIEAASQKSILNTIKDNIESAAINIIKKCGQFISSDDFDITLELNDNFDLGVMTAEQMRYTTEAYEKNGICYEDYHENLKRSGLTKLTFEEAKKKIIEDQAFKKLLIGDNNVEN